MSTTCYQAPMGVSVKWITAAAYCVLVLVAVLALGLGHQFRAPLVAVWITVGVTVAMGLVSLGARIRGYELGPTDLVIRYGLGRRVVRLADIVSVKPGNGLFSKSIRLCASGGLWSFTGLFLHFSLGKFRAYVSDLSKAILLETISDRIVISPANPAQFTDDLRARAPHIA